VIASQPNGQADRSFRRAEMLCSCKGLRISKMVTSNSCVLGSWVQELCWPLSSIFSGYATIRKEALWLF